MFVHTLDQFSTLAFGLFWGTGKYWETGSGKWDTGMGHGKGDMGLEMGNGTCWFRILAS